MSTVTIEVVRNEVVVEALTRTVTVTAESRNALYLRGKILGDLSAISVGETIVWDGTQFLPGETSAVESFADLSGQIANAQVPASAVTQHQAALSIAETQIPNGVLLARVADAEVISGAWSFSAAPTFSTMTAGSILFAGAGGILSDDNGKLFYDAANDYVGIGTATPSSFLHLVGGTLLNGTQTNSFMNVTGTLPSVPTSAKFGARVVITSAGSAAFDQTGMRVSLLGGYTGGNTTKAFDGANAVAGTGANVWAGGAGNYGAAFSAVGTTTGHNAAFQAVANSGKTNIGAMCLSIDADNAPDVNCAVAGHALNGTVNVAGYFALRNTTPTLSTAALIADNGAVAAPVALFRDNGTTFMVMEDGGQRTFGTGKGQATTATKLIKKATGIADNSATAVFTVTVPNANQSACIKLTFVSANGSTDAFESSRCAQGLIAVARTSGAATVATAATLALAAIATVSGGATHTLAYGVSSMTGANNATQTFTINVQIDDSGNVGSNQVLVLAEVLNSEATGLTIA